MTDITREEAIAELTVIQREDKMHVQYAPHIEDGQKVLNVSGSFTARQFEAMAWLVRNSDVM